MNFTSKNRSGVANRIAFSGLTAVVVFVVFIASSTTAAADSTPIAGAKPDAGLGPGAGANPTEGIGAPVRDLYAYGLSDTSIQVIWTDLDVGEVAYELYRAAGAGPLSLITTLGPDVDLFVDTGLSPASHYTYQLIALAGGGGTSVPSNLAAASTFPATAATICPEPILGWDEANRISTAYDGSNYAIVWQDLRSGMPNQIKFQSMDPATGAPIGSPVTAVATDTFATLPTLRSNGTEQLLVHYEIMFTEPHPTLPGRSIRPALRSSRLDSGGNRLRGPVTLFNGLGNPGEGLSFNTVPFYPTVWTGSEWAVLFNTLPSTAGGNLKLARISAGGEPVAPPVALTSSTLTNEDHVSIALGSGELGVTWTEWALGGLLPGEVKFQRFMLNGDPIGLPVTISTSGELGTDVLWTGTGWAVVWGESDINRNVVIDVQRLTPTGGLIGAAQRVSLPEDPGFPGLEPFDYFPKLRSRTGGGFFVYGLAFNYADSRFYSIRYELDATGNRIGGRQLIGPTEFAGTIDFDLATDGSEDFVAVSRNLSTTTEVGGVKLDATGPSIAGWQKIPSADASANRPAMSFLEAIGENFLVGWTSSPGGTRQLNARIIGPSGAVIASREPLTPSGTFSEGAVEVVGNSFATVWSPASAQLAFARYDATGLPLIAESTVVADFRGGRQRFAVGFDGQHYGITYVTNAGTNAIAFQRVDSAGNTIGTPQVFATPTNRVSSIRVERVDSGWGVLWFDIAAELHYALIDETGAMLVADTLIETGAAHSDQLALEFNGTALVAAWSIDDTIRLATMPTRAGGSPAAPASLILDAGGAAVIDIYWDVDRFRLVYRTSGSELRELGALSNGTLIGDNRPLTPLTRSDFQVHIANNGATLGMIWDLEHVLHFQTTECLSDSTRPSCPALAITSGASGPTLSWSAASDPQSGIFRYNIYRDGVLQHQTLSTTTSIIDTGYLPSMTHAYEVRAMNGAYLESGGCSATSFSTFAGDANGDETVDSFDVFYLVNHFFSGGPAPLGDSDVNGDDLVTVADQFYLTNFLFGGGAPPAEVGTGGVR